METMPRAALFLAGKAFLRYRAAGGARTGVLPDFFIGAHAAVEAIPLLTRDARRYRTYFPSLLVIAPRDVVTLAEKSWARIETSSASDRHTVRPRTSVNSASKYAEPDGGTP